MSIAAANLWTRNIYKAFLKPDATPAQEAQQAKLVSLVVKFGALIFVLALSKDFAINLQLLGGVWILRVGLVRSLWTFGIGQMLSTLGFVALAGLGRTDERHAEEKGDDEAASHAAMVALLESWRGLGRGCPHVLCKNCFRYKTPTDS